MPYSSRFTLSQNNIFKCFKDLKYHNQDTNDFNLDYFEYYLTELKKKGFIIYLITLKFYQITYTLDEHGNKEYHIKNKTFKYYHDAFIYLFEIYSKRVWERISKILEHNIFKYNREELPFIFLFPDNKHKYKGKPLNPNDPNIPHLHGFFIIHPNHKHHDNFKNILNDDIMDSLNFKKDKYLHTVYFNGEVEDIHVAAKYASSYMEDIEYSKFLDDKNYPFIICCNDSKIDTYKHHKGHFPKPTTKPTNNNHQIQTPNTFTIEDNKMCIPKDETKKPCLKYLMNFRLDDARRSKVENCSAQLDLDISGFIRKLIDDYKPDSILENTDMIVH